MFLSRIEITNFRNFEHLDVTLGPATVVVGENNVGKSNLLYALRLILDPRLSDAARQLRDEDFWDGLKEPVKGQKIIEIAVEFQDFKKDKNLFAVLQTYCIKGAVPDTARLTYRFRPKAPLPKNRALTIEDYEFLVFGGVDEKNRIDYELRRWIPVEVLPALRDAENDLAAWRQSPLRPLVERLNLAESTLKAVAAEMDKATGKLMTEKDIQQLTQDIQSRLGKMVGSVLAIDPSLGLAPTASDRLPKALRMFGDGVHQRPVGELSLGINNILYLLLLTIELERKEVASERATTILAIEEPEAHLHPHVQRLVFRDFLRRESPVILTTHSSHVASVAPLASIMLLRKDVKGGRSRGTSTVQAQLLPAEVEDLERYLDATRAEILFARGVILVEGAAELFLVPAIAAGMGKRLDENGVSVCSVHGTDFVPYAKLLGPKGLDIPFVILTDGDWYKSAKDGALLSRGLRRAVAVAKAIGHQDSPNLEGMFDARQWKDLYKAAEGIGVFVGKSILEVDLFNAGHHQEIVDTLSELGAKGTMSSTLQELVKRQGALTEGDVAALLASIERFGKGRVAQRLAGKVKVKTCPAYLKGAVERIVGVLSK